jgi:hypothetical protein
MNDTQIEIEGLPGFTLAKAGEIIGNNWQWNNGSNEWQELGPWASVVGERLDNESVGSFAKPIDYPKQAYESEVALKEETSDGTGMPHLPKKVITHNEYGFRIWPPIFEGYEVYGEAEPTENRSDLHLLMIREDGMAYICPDPISACSDKESSRSLGALCPVYKKVEA